MDTAQLGKETVYAPDLKRIDSLEERVRRASGGAEPLRCRCCESDVFFKGGTTLAWHFAHRPGSERACQLTEGDYENESAQHRQLKEAVVRWLRGRYGEAHVQPEGYVEEIGRFADVLLMLPSDASTERTARRVAFEIQCSPIGGPTWAERTADYAEAGVQDVWLLAGPAAMKRTGAASTPARAAGHDAERLTEKQRSFWLQDPLASEWNARPAQEEGEVWKTSPLAEKILQARGQVFVADASSEKDGNRRNADLKEAGQSARQNMHVTALVAAAAPYPASATSGPDRRVQALADLPFERQPPHLSRYRPLARTEPDSGKRIFPERAIFRAPLQECSVQPANENQERLSQEGALAESYSRQNGTPKPSPSLFVLSEHHELAIEGALRWEQAALQWETGWKERRAKWEEEQKCQREEKRRAERKQRQEKYAAVGSIVVEEMPALLEALVALQKESRSWSASRLQKSRALPKRARNQSLACWTPLTDFSLPMDWIFGCPPRL